MNYSAVFLGGLLAALSFGLSVRAAEPKPFEPMPGNQREAFRYDLEKNFYADEAAWKADIERARAGSTALERFRGKVLESPKTLLAVLDSLREQEDLLVKLYAYGEFTEAVDTRQRKFIEAYQSVRADSDGRTSFVKVELKALSATTLSGWVAQEPGLTRYRYLLEDAVRQAPHTLSEPEESILAALGPELTGWQQPLFQKSFDGHTFPELAGKSVYRDFDTLLRDPDRSVREKAFRGYYGELAKISDVAGFALLREMRALNSEAKRRGFPTYYHQSLFENYLSREEMDTLYAQIEAKAPLYRDYQEFRRHRIAAALGLKEAEIWDYDMPAGNHPQPRYTAQEGVALGLEALAVLGPHYRAELAALLDPANGRMDIGGGPNRGQGAFCEGDYAYFMDNYQGYLGDVATLVHESGHAVHHRLVRQKTGSLFFSFGPAYMTESFATFNEWLLRDHLLKTLKDERVKSSVREDALNEMMVLWEIARRAKFEMVAYDRVAAGTVTDEKGLDGVCDEVGRKYDVFFGRYPELDVHWMRKHHYWSVPTYYHNYVLAHLLALKYYQLYQDDPAGFSKKYVAMVENGFDRPAAALLKDFLGVDLKDAKLLEGTFAMMQKQLEAVKAEGR